MMRGVTLAGIGMILLLGSAETAHAGDVALLGTWNFGNSFSTPQIVVSARPVLLYPGPQGEVVAPLFEDFLPPTVYPAELNETVSRANESDFGMFADRLTDGVNDEWAVWAWADDGPIGGGGGRESDLLLMVPRFGLDLVGYEIESITEVLVVDLQSPGSDPFGDGVNTDWSVSGRYEFYGSPIPEPATILLFLGGALISSLRSRTGSSRRTNQVRVRHVAIGLALGSITFSDLTPSQAQCINGGTNNQVDGLAGDDLNRHDFLNQCLAVGGTNVEITIEAMADLGCNPWDGTHYAPQGDCPEGCNPPPFCCDTDPEEKYVTVTANLHPLTPSVPGSTNMPPDGYFFQAWDGYDCYGTSELCLQSGRSPCDPQHPGPNKRIVYIPAETWNDWLGASGNTMTIRVTSTAAVHSAPIETRSLALYCEELGFDLCPFQDCTGLCGPDTYSRVTISYSEPECITGADCYDGNPCTNDVCTNGVCSNPNNSAPCNDGIWCNGADACSGGSCSAHAGSPCDAGELCCELLEVCNETCCDDTDCPLYCDANADVCVECFDNADCDDGVYCNGEETCSGGVCQPGPPWPGGLTCFGQGVS